MTPAQIIGMAREEYNAVGETFWSDSELYNIVWRLCQEIATEAKCIERTYSTVSVADTQEYSYPSNTISIKQVTYNDVPLIKTDFREADKSQLYVNTTNVTGTPVYYTEWGGAIQLWPTPDTDDDDIKIYSYNNPQQITVTSTLEVPDVHHGRLVDGVLARMYSKDKDFNSAAYYDSKWSKSKQDIIQWTQRRKRGDRFASVKVEEWPGA